MSRLPPEMIEEILALAAAGRWRRGALKPLLLKYEISPSNYYYLKSRDRIKIPGQPSDGRKRNRNYLGAQYYRQRSEEQILLDLRSMLTSQYLKQQKRWGFK